MYQVTITSGLQAGAQQSLLLGEFRLGSADDCDIVLLDADIYPYHAKLKLTAKGAHLSPLPIDIVQDRGLVTKNVSTKNNSSVNALLANVVLDGKVLGARGAMLPHQAKIRLGLDCAIAIQSPHQPDSKVKKRGFFTRWLPPLCLALLAWFLYVNQFHADDTQPPSAKQATPTTLGNAVGVVTSPASPAGDSPTPEVDSTLNGASSSASGGLQAVEISSGDDVSTASTKGTKQRVAAALDDFVAVGFAPGEAIIVMLPDALPYVQIKGQPEKLFVGSYYKKQRIVSIGLRTITMSNASGTRVQRVKIVALKENLIN